MVLHILIDNHVQTPWWRCDQRLGIEANACVWCDLCNSWIDADKSECCSRRDHLPLGWEKDKGEYQLDEPGIGYEPSYFDPAWHVRCGEGFGCTVNARRRASAHMRERHWL